MLHPISDSDRASKCPLISLTFNLNHQPQVEDLNMVPVAFRFVQVLLYDLTSSSEDDHPGSNLLIWSAYLEAPKLTAGEHVESDHQTPVSSDNGTQVSPSPNVVKDELPEEVIILSNDEHSADDTLCLAVKQPKIKGTLPASLPSGTKAYTLKVSQLWTICVTFSNNCAPLLPSHTLSNVTDSS